jgi:manganese/zinc/iron transport system ATP- binding protein
MVVADTTKPAVVYPEATSAIEVEDLTVTYGDLPALWDVDLKVHSGVMMAVIGPNGAGKSTLIKTIMGFIRPVAGGVRVFGRPASSMLARMAYVPQRTVLDWDFPTDVLDVVMMGTYGTLGWCRRPGSRERAQALEALDRVGMEPLSRRAIGELSGGQAQRVLLARALVQAADVYLLDEPLQGLDAPTERAIVQVLHELRAEGKTILAAHHNLQTVPEYFDHVFLLNQRAIAWGPLREVFTEANVRATYLSESGLRVPVTVGA